MGERDLADLVRHWLFELGVTAGEVSRRSRGDVPAETLRGLARGQQFHRVGTGESVPDGVGDQQSAVLPLRG